MKAANVLALVSVTLVLTGCGPSEPTDAEMEKAINARWGSKPGEFAPIAFLNVKKIACKRVEKTFDCAATWQMAQGTARVLGSMSKSEHLTFIKTDKGWEVAGELYSLP
jgi:hypothetical protein